MKYFKPQDGIIAMVTTIMVSILLIMMALGLLILANGGTQQASDDELSLRAYAMAESGVEWAFANLVNGAGNLYPACNSIDSSGKTGAAAASATMPGGNDNVITCLTITNTTNAFKGSLSSTGEAQVILDRALATRVKKLRVSWIAAPHGAYTPWSPINNPLPSKPQNAGVELTLVDFASTGGMSVSGGPSFSIRNMAFLPSTSTGNLGNTKILANCRFGNVPYDCLAPDVADAPVNQGELIYIRGLYMPPGSKLDYNITFLDRFGNPILNIPTQNDIIDVTARSGPVYRRITAEAPLGVSLVPSALNYVLFSDNDICKDFSITAGPPATLNSLGCPGSP